MAEAFVDVSVTEYSGVTWFTITLVKAGVIEAKTVMTVVGVVFRRRALVYVRFTI